MRRVASRLKEAQLQVSHPAFGTIHMTRNHVLHLHTEHQIAFGGADAKGGTHRLLYEHARKTTLLSVEGRVLEAIIDLRIRIRQVEPAEETARSIGITA